MKLKPLPLLPWIILLPACFWSSVDWTPISDARLKELQGLSAKVHERETKCKEWHREGVEFVEQINRSDKQAIASKYWTQAFEQLKNYPGSPQELQTLQTIMIDAPKTSGFPKDYRWEWTKEVPLAHCAILDWFTLSKGLIAGADPAHKAALASVLTRQMRTELERDSTLTPHLISLALTQLMLERNVLQVSAAQKEELQKIDTDSSAFKKKLGSKDSTRETELFSKCKEGPRRHSGERSGDRGEKVICPRDVEVELSDIYGRGLAQEMIETRTLSGRLRQLLMAP